MMEKESKQMPLWRNLEQAAVEERPAHADRAFVLQPFQGVLGFRLRLLFRQVGEVDEIELEGVGPNEAFGSRPSNSIVVRKRSVTIHYGLRRAEQTIAVELSGEDQRRRLAVGPRGVLVHGAKQPQALLRLG